MCPLLEHDPKSQRQFLMTFTKLFFRIHRKAGFANGAKSSLDRAFNCTSHSTQREVEVVYFDQMAAPSHGFTWPKQVRTFQRPAGSTSSAVVGVTHDRVIRRVADGSNSRLQNLFRPIGLLWWGTTSRVVFRDLYYSYRRCTDWIKPGAVVSRGRFAAPFCFSDGTSPRSSCVLLFNVWPFTAGSYLMTPWPVADQVVTLTLRSSLLRRRYGPGLAC